MKAKGWIASYVLVVEVLYALYEWQAASVPLAQNMNALAIGLVLVGALFPSAIASPWIEWNLAQYLGYPVGDTTHVLPRLITLQICIFLNVLFLIFVFWKDIRRQRQSAAD